MRNGGTGTKLTVFTSSERVNFAVGSHQMCMTSVCGASTDVPNVSIRVTTLLSAQHTIRLAPLLKVGVGHASMSDRPHFATLGDDERVAQRRVKLSNFVRSVG